MIKSFNQYINESKEMGSDSSGYAIDVINCIRRNMSSGDEYIEIRELEYQNPDFDLVIQLKIDKSPDFDSDSHFKTLPWEEINFKHHGFAIDANTMIDRGDLILPEITITLILDSSRIPDLFNELKYRLIDITSHEINHLFQIGWNREPFKVRPSSNADRKSAKKSYKYFLLPDEIESMVKGAYDRSKEQGVSIDKIIDKYLYPFLKTNKITKAQYLQVLNAWIQHAAENYPDAKFSLEDEKIANIINKI
jgi:hypothetical protein